MADCLKNVLDVTIREKCDLLMWFKLHAFMAFGKLERLMSGGLAGEEGTAFTLLTPLSAGRHVSSIATSTQWRTQEFFSGGGGGSTNSVEDRGERERGSGGGSPLVRVSGGSCNLVQEISFHMVKFS